MVGQDVQLLILEINFFTGSMKENHQVLGFGNRKFKINFYRSFFNDKICDSKRKTPLFVQLCRRQNRKMLGFRIKQDDQRLSWTCVRSLQFGFAPTLDVLVSGGRDSVCRVWDIGARQQILVLEGYTNTIDSIIFVKNSNLRQQVELRFYDQIMGHDFWKMHIHFNQSQEIKSYSFSSIRYTFCSAASDNLKVLKCTEGTFFRNISDQNAMLNSIAFNRNNVLASAADNGSLYFWDCKSGYNFQQINAIAQPGSIAAENDIFCCTFDQSQKRFLTGEHVS